MVVPLLAYGAVAAGSALASSILGKKKGGAPFQSGMADETAYATRDFQQLFGRAPTASELAQIVPAYVGSNQHVPNTAQGKAFVAQMYDAQENTPDKVYARNQAGYLAKAPEHYNDINQLIQSSFGRAATKQELDHFGAMLASGQVDPYQIQDFFKSQPEYQNAQDKTFREGLNSELENYDRSFFDKAKEDVISRYAQMGRSTSPALDVALTDLQGQIADKRGQYLANLSATQYGGNKDAAMSNYRTTSDDWLNRRNQNTQAQFQTADKLTQRQNELADYTRQSQDFDRNYSLYGGGQQPGPLQYLNTGIQGANAFANVYKAFA